MRDTRSSSVSHAALLTSAHLLLFNFSLHYENFISRFAQMDSVLFLLTLLKIEADHKQHFAQKALEALNEGRFGKSLGLNTGCCNSSFLCFIYGENVCT